MRFGHARPDFSAGYLQPARPIALIEHLVAIGEQPVHAHVLTACDVPQRPGDWIEGRVRRVPQLLLAEVLDEVLGVFAKPVVSLEEELLGVHYSPVLGRDSSEGSVGSMSLGAISRQGFVPVPIDSQRQRQVSGVEVAGELASGFGMPDGPSRFPFLTHDMKGWFRRWRAELDILFTIRWRLAHMSKIGYGFDTFRRPVDPGDTSP